MTFAIGIGVPLLVLLSLGDPVAALAAAVGAWNALLTDPRRGIATRFIAIGVAVCVFAAAGATGYFLSESQGWAAVAILALVAMAAAVPPSLLYLSMVMKLAPVLLGFVATNPLHGDNLVIGYVVGCVFATLTAIAESMVLRTLPPIADPAAELRAIAAGEHNPASYMVAFIAAAAMALGIADASGASRPVWALAVALFVMHPERSQAMSNIFRRVGGTLLGAVAAWAIVAGIRDAWMLAAIVVACATLVPVSMRAGQFFAGLVATVLVLVAIDIAFLAQGGDVALVRERLVDTLLGAVAALAATLVQHAWDRRRS